MRKKSADLIIENVLIQDVASEGKAISRIGNKVLFVQGAVPGDLVNVRVYRKKQSYMEGRVEQMITPSTDRSEPFCKHFGICGGCSWQQLPYEKQLYYKEKQVRDVFERIGKLDTSGMKPILGSQDTVHYRNKLEYTFSSKRWLTKEEIATLEPVDESRGLGFHIPGKFDKVLDIETCHLQPEPSNSIRLRAKEIALELGLEFYNMHSHEGFLRNLMIRNNSKGDFMVVVMFKKDDPTLRDAFLSRLAQSFPAIKSLQYVINPKQNDAWADQEVILFQGEDHLLEYMEDKRFRIGPKSFFQTNTRQGLKLYQITREFAALTGYENVYDLYTGTGTIALFLASHCQKVTGIEYVKEATDDARINASLNKIDNASFFAGDMKDVITPEFFLQHGKPDVVVLDPPRAGVHADVIQRIRQAAPERIVYVSCNPATQARDLALLADVYELKAIQPVDMFPHTMHVENVAWLVHKK